MSTRLQAALLLGPLGLGACASATFDQTAACPTPDENTVFVVSRGRHVEVKLPASQLSGALAVYRDIFPGARTVMFGYGKRTFLTAPPDTISEYLLGPVPGPAAIQVTGLAATPIEAYPPEATRPLELPPGGARALSAFIADDLARDRAGEPQLLGPGPFPGSLFFGATSGYSLAHTCNTWAANALAAAGLPISADGVLFSGQVVKQVAVVKTGQCLAAARRARSARERRCHR